MSTHKVDYTALERALTGQVSYPGDARYNDAVSLWNGAIKRRPAAVAHCRDAVEVSSAIMFAKDSGCELSIRGGGHNPAGNALSPGGLTIDLSAMREVKVDPGRRRARCGGGARWLELDAACQEHGLAVTGGMISHTGVAGLTLGGGVGWLHAKAGLSCDNLISAQVVTSDGVVVRATESEHTDLFWALRGGGGNFGVVTELEFRLTQVGPVVQLGAFFYRPDKAAAMLRFANELTRTLDDDFGVFIAALNAPAAPFVPPEWQQQLCYVLAVVGFGEPELHAHAVQAIRKAVPPTFELVTPIPYVELQRMFDASAPWGIHAYEKGLYLEELTDEVIEVITRNVLQKPTAQSFVPILALRGAYARAGEGSVAFGGRRSHRYSVNISGLTHDPAQLEPAVAWTRAFWSELVSHADGIGSYVNFIFEPDEARVRASYGPAKYERLAAVKAKYDPGNLFHLNANIKPASRK
ncbi:MAG: FAD-binding oxidoreductase [Polyangiales bacterium]